MGFLASALRKSYKVISKLPGFYLPYRIAGGRIFLDITESPMMLARILGRYEVSKHRAILSMLNPESTFIDVGGNKGDFSLLAAKIVGGKGRVLAFEPEPENCRWMRKSIELNGYKNIQLYEVALADRIGHAQLHLGEGSGFHSIISGLKNRDRGAVTVETTTLDSFLEDTGLDSQTIDMIKIDVEGAEMRVLRGASGMLSAVEHLVLLMDIHPNLGVDSREVCEYLVEKSFSIFREQSPLSVPAAEYADLTSIVARK